MKSKLIPTSIFIFLFLIFNSTKIKANNNEISQDNKSGSGTLVIVGGALADSNHAIFNAMLNSVGGVDNAKVAIIPTASSKPSKYGTLFKNKMIELGVDSKAIHILPIAVTDDTSTKSIDESTWHENANDIELVKLLSNKNLVWFTGGDQTRITQTLVNQDGSDSLVLEQLRRIYNQGGTIGGTSAGAAIMSNTMIASGDSYSALKMGFTEHYNSMDEQENGPVLLSKGLGYFAHGVIDQHFDRKARLGRLIAVLHKQNEKLGFGIDEDTALVFNASSNTFTVYGPGMVTVADISNSQIKRDTHKGLTANNIDISLLSSGDSFNISTKKITAHKSKVSTINHEIYSVPKPIVTGTLSRNSTLKQLLTYDLIDNKAAKSVKSYLFNDGNTGFELVFEQTGKTKGYWAYFDGMKDFYSAFHIDMSIKPISIEIKDL